MASEAIAPSKLGTWLSFASLRIPVRGESADTRLRRMIGVAVIVGAIPTYFIYGTIYSIFGEYTAGGIAFIGGFLFAVGLISFRIFPRYGTHWAYWMTVLTATLSAIHFALGGFAQSGMVAVWLLSVPLLTIVCDKPANGLRWSFIIASVFVAAAFLDFGFDHANNLPAGLVTGLYLANMLGLGVYILLSMSFYVWQVELLNARILQEQEKSEELLQNILPRAVIDELKKAGSSEPRRYEEATILFADFVGFTQTAGMLPATRLVRELDEIFRGFDDIVTEHGVEKIKTIGDAYMAVSGVPVVGINDAGRCVRAGLEMVRFIDNRNKVASLKWRIRVGIHTGSLVGGIVGKRKFAFDIWGDSVNVASRLESSSEEGRVNISAYTFDLIRNQFDCLYRGRHATKGKGDMEMYFVVAEKTADIAV